MRLRKIQNTPVAVTELGFGAAVIGHLYRVTPSFDTAAAIDTAGDAGIRYFGTAPHYGLGLAGRRLGDAHQVRPREEYVISSKVGRLLVPNERPCGVDSEGFAVRDDLRRQGDFGRDGVLRSFEETLRRTGLDRLDVVHLHDPDDHGRQAADEAMPARGPARPGRERRDRRRYEPVGDAGPPPARDGRRRGDARRALHPPRPVRVGRRPFRGAGAGQERPRGRRAQLPTALP